MNKQCGGALNAISRLSQASDFLLCNLLSVTESPRFNVPSVTVSKEYPQAYKMCWQLDDTSWRTLAEALTTLDPEREDLMEFHTHIMAEPADEYARLSFDYEGHEFMCMMLREQAERLGYIEPEPEQMAIEGV